MQLMISQKRTERDFLFLPDFDSFYCFSPSVFCLMVCLCFVWFCLLLVCFLFVAFFMFRKVFVLLFPVPYFQKVLPIRGAIEDF